MKSVNGHLPENTRCNQIGQEQNPLFVVEDFFDTPQVLINEAKDNVAFKTDDSDFYPGVRKPINQEYRDYVCRFIEQNLLPFLPEFDHSSATCSKSVYSIANVSPKQLLPIQRIPHFDTQEPRQWAVVHYLCEPQMGGTGFFRHQKTGYESMSPDRSRHYQRVLDDQATTEGLPPAAYLQGSTELFEMIHSVDAKFNRAIIYPGNLFHSGLIKKWQVQGVGDSRLTANSFVLLF